MKTLKSVLLGIIGLVAWIQVGVSGEMIQLKRAELGDWGFYSYPALLVISVLYLHWIFRSFLMPLFYLPDLSRHALQKQAAAQYSKSFFAGTIGFGYFLLALYVIGFVAELRGIREIPNLAMPAVFFIALGTIAKARGLIQVLVSAANIGEKSDSERMGAAET